MSDPLAITTSFLSIISCTYTIVLLTREWKRRLEFTKEVFSIHQREIEVLRSVVRECQEIASSATNVPESIEESFKNCASREKSLSDTLAPEQEVTSNFTKTVRLSLLKKDVKRRYAMFRESVLLLRDLCLELRTQQQLVDMSAGMARLASDFLEEEDETDGQEDAHPAAMPKSNTKTHTRLISALKQLGSSNYVVKATVVVEQPSQERGQRFKYISTAAEHTPALVKLDTGSDVDVVSQEFLDQAGFTTNAFIPIPEEAKDSFIDIGGTTYRPKSTIELFWFREGEQRIRKTRFYVVSGAPVDMLLGSKQFAQEAAKRVALFASPPKSKATRELEQQREAERLQEAAQVEEARFQEELRRRQIPHAVSDLEHGPATPASVMPQSER